MSYFPVMSYTITKNTNFTCSLNCGKKLVVQKSGRQTIFLQNEHKVLRSALLNFPMLSYARLEPLWSIHLIHCLHKDPCNVRCLLNLVFQVCVKRVFTKPQRSSFAHSMSALYEKPGFSYYLDFQLLKFTFVQISIVQCKQILSKNDDWSFVKLFEQMLAWNHFSRATIVSSSG